MSPSLPMIATLVIPCATPGPFGLFATIDDRPCFYPNLEAAFRAVVQLLDAEGTSTGSCQTTASHPQTIAIG